MTVPNFLISVPNFPVRAVANGIYQGQREYSHVKPLKGDCKPLVIFHPSKLKDDKSVYTSIYCHVEPLPENELKIGDDVSVGQKIGYLEDPEGAWGAHVHLELYTREVYQSKDSTKRSRCGCSSDKKCDDITRKKRSIPRGCGIFEDDLYLLEPILFIKRHKK